MNVSRACSGTLSSENDDFDFFETTKNMKCTCTTCTIFPGLEELFISPNQFIFDQKHERNSSQRTVLYIFSKY